MIWNIILPLSVCMALMSCSSEEYVWKEYFKMEDETQIVVVHNNHCEHKTWFHGWVKCPLRNFCKQGNTVYDYCINVKEADRLNRHSNRNINSHIEINLKYPCKDAKERENNLKFINTFDTSDRKYKVYYSLDCRDVLKPLLKGMDADEIREQCKEIDT